MEESIFTKIVKGELPAHKIYENELTLAFLDLHPTSPGHVLVIPKEQIEFVWDLPNEIYHAVMATTKKLALHMREVLSVRYIHESVVGTDVPHAHVHLIPFNDKSELTSEADTNAEPDHDALAQMADKLRIS